MVTTTNNTEYIEQRVNQQQSEIARLKGRIGALSEDIDAMKADIANFRRRVTDDMTPLVENVQKEKKRR